MKSIFRRVTWLGVICGLACSSAEPGEPERIAGHRDQVPADAGVSPTHDEQGRASRTGEPDAGGAAHAGASSSGSSSSGSSATRVEWLDALVSPLIESEWLSGVSIALVKGGEVETYGYGAVRDGGAVPDGETLFEIGSVTKTFTGLLLAELVRDGSVELDQPVASLLPPGVSVPELDGRAITLLDLATHTSGLPRLPTNWVPEVATDPYADYQVEDLYEFLSSYTLPVAPGERFEYSNVGAGLLGHALSLAAGTSYEEALERRILEPLGLKDTTLHPSADQARRLASGHDLELEAVPSWAFTPAIEGAGALRSSAQDMGRYIAAELAAGAASDAGLPATLLASMALTQIPQRTTDTGEPIGLAWFLAGPDIFQHSGGTGGFSSFALADRASGVGVVVLANTATRVADALGMQLYQRLLGDTPAPLDLPVLVHLDVAALEPCVGTYRFGEEIGVDVSVVREADRLYAVMPDGRRRLYPMSTTMFWSKVDNAVIRFEPDGAEQYLTFVLQYSADESYRATRL